ncbi:MAG: hypothetical protein F6K28_51140 [Microcoleus sp. SIO2G3]|nr:hypothetical protein [Microcoleus sp. SIO2G3]
MPKLPVKDPAQPSFARAEAASYSFTEDRFAAVTSQSAKLMALITQFQARYPNASLVAELLMMHENQFVVRALVQIGGAALVSGMAAAADIEQAEDRAKLRALEMLTLQPIAPLEGFTPRPEIPAVQSGSAVQSGYNLQLRVSTPEAIAERRDTAPAEPLPVSASLPADFSPSLPAIEPKIEPSDDFTAEPSPIAAVGVPDIPLPTWEPEPEPTPEPEPIPESEPIDMSDAIARTSVELKRLGWTNVKGREHLEKTYSKRSRQQLTDTELLDFLRFLESQPSPGQSPF